MIKNIIFDLGGVLLRLDYERVPKAFEELGHATFREIYSQNKQEGFFNDFETGKMDPSEFRNIIRGNRSGLKDEDIDLAWNSILLDLPREYMNVLVETKKKYRLFILSNTNAIHVEAFEKIIANTVGMEEFKGQFEEVYYSNRIGLRKPDQSAYRFVLNLHNLKAEETLFIDDTEKNVNSAKSLNMKAYLYPQNKNLSMHLARILAEFN